MTIPAHRSADPVADAVGTSAPRRALSWRDLGPTEVGNGFVGWLFAASAPVAVILTSGRQGNLSEAQIASWIFGVFFVNGLITLAFSLRWRMPLAFGWTIPGTVLVGPALEHTTLAEVVGAYLVTGVLIVLLGASGWVKKVMAATPLPIVMAMVAGVFLRFGLDLVRSLHDDPAIAWPMVLAFVALSAWPRVAARVPPLIAVLVVGTVAVAMSGRFDLGALGAPSLVRPVWQMPTWSLPAMLELVLPLAITVLVVQNGQGFAVLKSAGHEPPVNAVTIASGVGTLAAAFVGSVCSCLTGPTNGILTSSGARERHRMAALVFGTLAIAFGLLAPMLTRVLLHAPPAFVATLAGLALVRVIQNALVTAFKDRFILGAVTTLLVTVADRPLLGIGAPFWGLVAGVVVAGVLERKDFR